MLEAFSNLWSTCKLQARGAYAIYCKEALWRVQFRSHNIQCTLYSVHCTLRVLFTTHYTMFIVHRVVYCELYTKQCTVYTIHGISYIVQCAACIHSMYNVLPSVQFTCFTVSNEVLYIPTCHTAALTATKHVQCKHFITHVLNLKCSCSPPAHTHTCHC